MVRSQLGLLLLLPLCCAIAAAQGNSAAKYTIAIKSYAPYNTDIFVAARDGSNARPLVPNSALDYNATFSRDGRWIVFTSHRAGSADIYRVHPDGSQLERLTDNPAFDDQGALSPDGKTLAFVSSRSGQADIWVLDLATHKLRNITNHPAGDFRPAWSPDGQWIAFSSDRDPRIKACPATTAPGPAPFVTPQFTRIYIVNPDGSGLRGITDSSELAGTPHWSPDGSHLIFYTAALDQVCKGGLIFGNGLSQIASANWKTGERKTITEGVGLKVFPRYVDSNEIAYQTSTGLKFTSGVELAGDFEAPDWSPDGRSMIFHREVAVGAERDNKVRPWPSMDPSFALRRFPYPASFSPNGDRMVHGLINLHGESRNGSIVVARADGSDRKVIFEGPATDDLILPVWSPRGDVILFTLGGLYQRETIKPARLMSIRPDGSGLTALTAADENSGSPSWSPDGKQVAYRVTKGPVRGLHILDLATGKSRKLETGSEYDVFPDWSPRGDWIAFTSKRDGDYEIYRIRPDGSGLQRLTHAPGKNAHSSFSPDGKWIAFSTGMQGFKDEAIHMLLPSPAGLTFQPYGEIAVMRADGSNIHLLTDNSTEEGAPSWLPTRKR